ncbi:hypothetical protein BT96DRAFT_1004606 [Gymnopus androsaceus JB14]|uniref:Uncharacterized protein n=1 Tax=Gymnopus androsaceus JB14 TaxID=1447944 RepID=A0A6A4GQB8_9AGAR|nr:hypothetical protein BT96DRAFT_1004606 [Gymnopus androsaceus JB14]
MSIYAGYKLQKHIATAMKTRLKLIQAAINTYNEAAAALHPPHQTITWDQVVEYSFLGEFELLCDTREDVRLQKWATPAADSASLIQKITISVMGRFAKDPDNF